MLKFIRDSNWSSKGHASLLFIILFLSFLSVNLESYSQTLEYSPIITEINLMIDDLPASREMKELIPVKEGESFSLRRITESIKQIYKSGLFSDIQVLKEGGQRIKLTFLLTKKLYTQKIVFIGSSDIPRNKLKEDLYALREGSSYSEDNLSKAIEELKQVLNKEGFFQAEIKAITERDPTTSQVDVSFVIRSTKRFVISKISFTGEVLLLEDELRKKIQTKEGKDFIPSILEDDIPRLQEIYNSMDYRRAEVEVKEQIFNEKEGKISLLIEVIPHEKIEIVVKGAEVPLNLLRPIWEARIFEEWGLAEGRAKIIAYMREKGHLFSSVNSSIERKDNKILVVYDVSPGERYKIQNISFKGLEYFTPSQIKEELMIGQRIPFLSGIDGARLFELPREIEFLYKNHGFPDTGVDLKFEMQGKKVKPFFFIEEGKQEKIKSISVEGVYLFGQEMLLEQISSVHGGAFFQPNIQKDIEKLESFYLNQGVRGTEISAEIQRVDEDLFSINFKVKEGKKVKIENIVITGNKVTRKSTILRELLIREGGYARYDSIRETKRKLERLGIFTEVKIEELLVSPDKENLLISVREGERNYASLGLGLETRNEPRSFAIWNNVVRPRGTAEFIRSNIFGSAAQASLVGQISLKEKRAVFSWEQPYFFGLPMETFLNVWLEREERKSFTYERRGISLTGIKSLFEKENMTLLTTLRLARTTLVELDISESEVDRQYFPFSTTSISGSFIWDKRDDPFNPEKGHFFSSVLEWAYPLFNAESDFLKTFTKFQHFVPILPDVTFNTTIRLGLGRGRMPIHERFFGGGSNSFRGAEFDELGPEDPDSLKPIGGKALILFNFELTFPLLSAFKNLFGTVFYDKGNVWERRKQVNLASFEDALGLGLRYRTPLGPIRLELGWNLDAPQGEKKILGFITIGHVF